MAVLIYLLSLVVVAFTALYLSFKKSYRLWHTLNVPHIPPTFPLGNFQQSLKKRHFAYITQDLYEQLKGQRDYAGVYVFQSPALFVISPEFAKDVLVRDFNTFVDRGVYFNRKADPLSANLFFLEGNEWKALRQKLSPAFTSGRMKVMFHTVTTVADELAAYVSAEGSSGEDVDVKDLMARFTTDVISSCVFGLEGNSLKDADSEFRRVGRQVMNLGKLKSFLTFVAMVLREPARQMGFRVFDQESTDFFTNMVHESIGYRRENNIHRNDLLQIMIDHLHLVDEPKAADEGFTIDEVAANSFIFFFAGFETSSTTLTVALHHLAHNQEIQFQARAEVRRVLEKYDDKITYEGLAEMDLLERIVLETLRIFPPVASLHRISNKPYTLANGGVVPAGTFLILPVYAFHHDKDIYPEPEKFDPDRFTDENKAKRHPYSYLPFGEGHRICIGQRFAMMQIKVALATLLSKFVVKASDRTKDIEMDEISITVNPHGSVWLKIEKI